MKAIPSLIDTTVFDIKVYQSAGYTDLGKREGLPFTNRYRDLNSDSEAEISITLVYRVNRVKIRTSSLRRDKPRRQ